jgi:hypothetical protein
MSDEMQRALRALGRLPPDSPLSTDEIELVLTPREEGLSEKVVPVEQVVKKIIGSRDKLRVLEQRVNASGLSQDEKLALQARITSVYDAFATLSAFFSDDALPTAADDDGEADA